MRVCIDLATGRIVEAQSGGTGDEALDVLRQNAAAAGIHDVECRYVDDAEFAELLASLPPMSLPETVVAKKIALAAYRYDKEVGGLLLPNGMRVATDDRSKTLIAGARLDTIDDPTVLTEFKAETGWLQIDAATVTMISTAVAAHVRGCFSAERAHSEAIDADRKSVV